MDCLEARLARIEQATIRIEVQLAANIPNLATSA
jgi:hypothetical protein